MTTDELIAKLRELDPEGKKTVEIAWNWLTKDIDGIELEKGKIVLYPGN